MKTLKFFNIVLILTILIIVGGTMGVSALPGEASKAAAEAAAAGVIQGAGAPAVAATAGSIAYAASCSQADIQAAVDAASDGDTVLVPEGPPCTWTTQASHTPAVLIQGKGIVLRGAGPGKTVIHIETGGNFHEYGLGIDAQGKPVRVTQFTFISDLNSPQAIIGIYDATSRNWRIDHNHFYNKGQRAIWARGTGVIDHCYFRKTAHGQGLAVGGNGDDSWNEPLSLGTDNAVYVEDCTFDFDGSYDGALDAYNGARYVFRYNQVNGTALGHHGLDSGNYRSTFSYEVYNNVFDATPPYDNGGVNIFRVFRSRGGTGVLFNNTAIGNYNDSTALLLTNYRSCPTFEGHHTGETQANYLEDSAANFLSDESRCSWVYNVTDRSYGEITAVTATRVYAVLQGGTRNNWQPGDQYAVAFFFNSNTNSMCMGTGEVDGNQPGGEGYPCMDQPGRTTGQTLAPTYQWNNFLNGSPMTFNADYCQRHATLHVLENRDFYNDTPRPGYTPYVYPHPLTQDLVLTGSPAEESIYLDWDVAAWTYLPPTSTWRITYYSETVPSPVVHTGIVSPTRAYTLTGLVNYEWYTVTLDAMAGSASWLSDTVRVMPTNIFVYLPLVLRQSP